MAFPKTVILRSEATKNLLTAPPLGGQLRAFRPFASLRVTWNNLPLRQNLSAMGVEAYYLITGLTTGDDLA